MRRAIVYFKDDIAGYLSDMEDHFEFAYTDEYINNGGHYIYYLTYTKRKIHF